MPKGKLTLLCAAAVGCVALAAPAGAGGAGDPVARCDALAANPDDRSDPNRPGVLFDDIDALAAIEACTAATKARPADARLRYQLGRALDRANRKTEALAAYDKAGTGGYALGLFDAGWMFENADGVEQDDAKAAAYFRRGADRGNAAAQNELGIFYENGRGGLPQDYKEAARLYRMAADQGHGLATANLGNVYDNGWIGPRDEKKAAELYQAAIDIGDDDGVMQGSNGLAWMYVTQNRDLAKAETLARQAVALDENDASYRDTLAYVLFREGQYDEALALELKAVADDPRLADYQMRLGDIYDALGRRKEARRAWRKALALPWTKDDEYGDFRRDVYEAKLAK